MSRPTEAEIEEFLYILNEPEHDEHGATIQTLSMISGFMKTDFSEEEFEHAVYRFLATYERAFPLTDEEKAELLALPGVLHNQEIKQRLKEIFYYVLKTDGISGKVLKQHYHESNDIFVEKVIQFFDTEMAQEFSQYEGPAENMELGKAVMECRKELLQNPTFITKLKTQYMFDDFRTDFYRFVSRTRLRHPEMDLKSAITHVVNDWKAHDENFRQQMKTEDGRMEVQTILKQMSHPVIQKQWGRYLRKEEQQGFAAYEEMLAYLKELLMKRIQVHLDFSRHLSQKRYNLSEKPQRKEFLNEYFCIGPGAVPVIYGIIHESILMEVKRHFLDLLIAFPIVINEKEMDHIISKLDKVIKEYSDYLEPQLSKEYQPFADRFEKLFNYVGDMANNIQKSRNRDGIRSLFAFSPISVVRTIFKVYNEEKTFDQNLNLADEKVWELYTKYKRSLPGLEKKLLQFYADFYEEIRGKIFMPFVQHMFHREHPVGQLFGIEEFEKALFTCVEEMRAENQFVQPVDLDAFYRSLDAKFSQIPDLQPLGKLKLGTHYLDTRYLQKKELKLSTCSG
ncbi:hypothetical protein [Bacillus sp. V59.32b]|uniref:hypothetical protein n=1 Tax=Bacillus sp. V59.32b TaxID=1758642 RepID=UPI000E3CF439|nr:hypothetical protein [Bacillus sp. V59.32b]RFU69626.1 hypothetical protein D0463_01995 [Bacillus sp. V59.32b]